MLKKKLVLAILTILLLILSYPSVFAVVSQFDLRNQIIIPVKNQLNSCGCWTFTMSTVFETNLALKYNKMMSISGRHMDYATSQGFVNGEVNEFGFAKPVNSGGTAEIALAYLTNGSGPIAEYEMPFSTYYGQMYLSEIKDKVVNYEVDKWVNFPSIYKISNGVYVNAVNIDGSYTMENMYSWTEVNDIRNSIKEHIMNNGAVYAALNAESGFADHYNFNTYSYYCSDYTRPLDHAVAIIGWDDNYPRERFKSGNMPSSNGAYIVQNSWGDDPRMNNGTFYVSYEDALIESGIYGIVSVNEKNYDKIYQYDQLGRNQYLELRFGDEIYGANVFKRNSYGNEIISKIAISTYMDVECEVYLNPYGSDFSPYNLIKVGESFVQAGYSTIYFNKPIVLKFNRFSVVVKYKRAGGKLGVTTLARVDTGMDVNLYKDVRSYAGQSYIGTSLDEMIDLYSGGSKDTNICIKAFTREYNGGDANNDGQITALDLAIMKMYLVGERSAESEEDLHLVDVNGDGRVTALDLARLKLMIIGAY